MFYKIHIGNKKIFLFFLKLFSDKIFILILDIACKNECCIRMKISYEKSIEKKEEEEKIFPQYAICK